MECTKAIATLTISLSCMIMPNSAPAEEDSFPLSLWGIFHWAYDFPKTDSAWQKEADNLLRIKANLLEDDLRNDTLVVMRLSDTTNYRAFCDYDPRFLENTWPPSPPIDSMLHMYWPKVYDGSIGDWPATTDTYLLNMYNAYADQQGFAGYRVAHEDESKLYTPSYYPGLEYVCQKVDQIDPDPNHKTIASGSMGKDSAGQYWIPDYFPESVPSLDIFETGDYLFRSGLIYDSQDSSYQAKLDTLAANFTRARALFSDTHTEWRAIIQTQEAWIRDSGVWYETHRRPTQQEIRCQAFLALSRGAKGITYYVYGSRPRDGGTYAANGLVDSLRNPFGEYFDYVKKLNDDLATIGHTLRNLYCTAAFSDDSIPAESYLDSLTGDWVEIGIFKDTLINTDYFMLVNRVCNKADGSPAHGQVTEIRVKRSGEWSITDVLSGDCTDCGYDDKGYPYFTAALPPGEGRLFIVKEGSCPR